MASLKHTLIPAISLLVAFPLLHGQGAVGNIYQQHCAVCHGAGMDGGLGGSLLTPELTYGDSPAILARVIREGLPDDGMEAFKDVLSEEEIHSLVVYIREMRASELADKGPEKVSEDREIYKTETHSYELEIVAETSGEIWGMDFLPNGDILFTEKEGNLRILRTDGTVTDSIKGLPNIWHRGQGGLMEVALHPNFEDNGWVYLGYSEPSQRRSGRGQTTVARGRIVDHEWFDHETIWRADDSFYTSARHHFGTRIVFQDGYLFFTIGDRGDMQESQNLASPNGNTFRIYDDGRIPEDNPFVGRENALPEIWSYGHRNAQGMDIHPETGVIWQTEHGPRGGDELNRIGRGLNYGWPVISYGINYNGRPITHLTEKEGMEQPVIDWTPSIAVCGIAFYTGDKFPEWRNNLFVGGLAAQVVHRVVLDGDEAVHEEVILSDRGRVRDIANGPDGYIYLAINVTRHEGRSEIVRMKPAED
ncbi:MAG: PQQ-dependent sugar dehydrogenase [Opitutales bacterium]|nr:PQQ-dependent sugar dehydrogenase [Opitutales bacterium]